MFEHSLTKHAPVLFIDIVGGLVGFVIAMGWWKASGRVLDREAVLFLTKLFGGIAVLGMVLAFII